MNREELKDRWKHLLRQKAEDYEHEAMRHGEVVTSPSLDEICNEIEAFFTGLTPPTGDKK